jgi:hypothetical protein
MTNYTIDLGRKVEWGPRDDLSNLERDFDLAPGSNGKWYLWWRAERAWIASFPTRAIAERFLIGDWDGVSGNPGWDRGDPEILSVPDIVAALYGYREKHGQFPQFALDAGSTLLEFLTRIDTDLGLHFLGNIIDYEGGDAEYKPEVFLPLVAQHLAAGDYGLDESSIALLAPQVLELLMRSPSPRGCINQLIAMHRTKRN